MQLEGCETFPLNDHVTNEEVCRKIQAATEEYIQNLASGLENGKNF